ncbi:cytochrome b [Frateuria aurantia]
MSVLSNTQRWGAVARIFHWVMALAIIVNGVWGLLMVAMAPSMSKIQVFALHKSIGLTVLALGLLRLAWRLFDHHPAAEPAPRWQQLAATLTHAGLYGLILAIPLSGWWFNSASGYPLQWFKRFNLPALGARNTDLAATAKNVHEYLFWLLVLVLVLHVGAALKHHYLDRDNTLLRMLPFARRKPHAEKESIS